MSGVLSMTVYGRCGHSPAGGFVTPTNTMFQLPPTQRDHSALRDNHCCCDPELTVPSMIESAMNPPLDHPPSHRFRFPLMCMRRNAVACETAQTITSPSTLGVTERFSTQRQKLHVALLFRIQRALDRTAPTIDTSS